ncbi:PIG-L deacetylase family protein [Micromonospora sp. HM5-17]|jgi:4-oxalomesaconate hydratase|uniref:PIG-L deacetylase family protein n=1 Tax=Micromonospora sp. HM5-17 TaxID=2487710 RepID=UPI000F46F4B4|nr:PIG-L deacetylase family protein [Micromonospora sp. HM5-17]ROT27248.1 PIG-L family deacetylase [Micromonospora sp. HM5-17]
MTTSATGRGPVLVVSAHAADFVWRAGGAIALSASRGQPVHVLCLTFGEKGESQGLWKQPGMTLDRVKEARRDEASRAAAVLGAEIEFLDAGDYPLRATDELYDRVIATIRRTNPAVILTHAARDPYNLDHALTHEIVLRSRMVAQAAGHDPSSRPIGAPQVLQFEPHQPEQCGFVPNLLLDITEVFDRKVEAMRIMGAQSHLVAYYTDLGVRRGVQAVRNGGARSITHAEAYQRVFPVVGDELC